MSRTETTIRTLYQFDDLSERAKETARDWYRGCIESDELSDYDDWQSIAEILGISFATRSVPLMNGSTRQEPKIYWSGFSSQGDGASWEGYYSYETGCARFIRAYAPQDTELHRIADALQSIQRRNFYQISASIVQGRYGSHYYHSGTMNAEIERADCYEWASEMDDTDAIQQLMRDFADWMYKQLEAQWEYLHSAESIDDNIAANEYEFDSEGNVA